MRNDNKLIWEAFEREAPAEDFESLLGAEDKFPDGKDKYELADVGGLHGQSKMKGKMFNSLKDACAAAGVDIKDCYNDEEWEDMEGDGITLEFAVDEDTAIIMHKFDGPKRDIPTSGSRFSNIDLDDYNL